MSRLSRALMVGGSMLAAGLLAACGSSSGLLSAGQAGTLRNELNTVSNDISGGQCISANRQIQTIQTQVAQLPGTVNPTLVNDLSRGASTVLSLAKSQCGANVGTPTGATSTPTPATTTTTTTRTATSTSTTTTPTTSTSTTTTPTSTTPTTTTPTVTTPSTPATTTTTPGTGTTGSNGGAGLPGAGGAGNSQ